MTDLEHLTFVVSAAPKQDQEDNDQNCNSQSCNHSNYHRIETIRSWGWRNR